LVFPITQQLLVAKPDNPRRINSLLLYRNAKSIDQTHELQVPPPTFLKETRAWSGILLLLTEQAL